MIWACKRQFLKGAVKFSCGSKMNEIDLIKIDDLLDIDLLEMVWVCSKTIHAPIWPSLVQTLARIEEMVEKYMPEAITNGYLWHVYTQKEIDELGRS